MSAATSLLRRIDEDRAERLRHLLRPGAIDVEQRLRARVSAWPELQAAIVRGIAVASSLSYHHPGQDTQTYLAHPLRVASLYLDVAPAPSGWGVSLALLHNVLEVAKVDEAALASEFGTPFFDALVILTVDRAQQWDEIYKDRYYGAIGASPTDVGAVKVIDKIDNLYLLSLNANDEVRARYLAEIERWVLPLAERCVPVAVPLMCELVARNRAIGHRPLHAWSLE